MESCIKRQRERVEGQLQHRCINRQAEKYLNIVQDHDCGACPARILLAKKGCNDKMSPVVQLPVIQDGFRVCALRTAGKCNVTGLGVTTEQCNNCVGEAEAEATSVGFTAKAFAYVDAVKVWIQKGRPRRTDEQVAAIFDEHCSKCERFDAETKSCKSCGCAVAPTGHPLGNKISMATEKCPLGRW